VSPGLFSLRKEEVWNFRCQPWWPQAHKRSGILATWTTTWSGSLHRSSLPLDVTSWWLRIPHSLATKLTRWGSLPPYLINRYLHPKKGQTYTTNYRPWRYAASSPAKESNGTNDSQQNRMLHLHS
jgi:hypothetical protein